MSQNATHPQSVFEQGKFFLKRIPFLVRVKQKIWHFLNVEKIRGISKIDLTQSFKLHTPYSAGRYAQVAQLTIDSINQTTTLLNELASINNPKVDQIIDLDAQAFANKGDSKVKELADLFNRYGSDKAKGHNYYLLYPQLLTTNTKLILEIGLGTNNKNIVSNMGNIGHPGSSLRAFRDFCPEAHVYGADVDKEILFTEERISTYWTDQTSDGVMKSFFDTLPNNFDLIIDDGLHSPHANLRTLLCSLPKLRVGGWVIIEDISEDAIILWQLVSKMLPSEKYKTQLYRTQKAILFAASRLT